jgi:hypothetical protein
MHNAQIEALLRGLDQGYNHKAWHGPNLRGSLRGLTARQAAWRPARGRHNIWEIALHAAYWKYAVRRRLTGEKRGSFALKGSNWFARPGSGDEKEWRADLALLEREHQLLRAVVRVFPHRKLHRRLKGSTWSCFDTIQGVALHDVYHAGQIQLLKRLQRARTK